jgi:DNA (cytosine-5)-methyltransferase 1
MDRSSKCVTTYRGLKSGELFRAVDLFAGAGGLSLGFHQAGVEITHAVEEDVWAAETYSRNLHKTRMHVGDIRAIQPSDLTDGGPVKIDFVVGGPPCQGFSVANVNRDPLDPRNSLFEDFIRVVSALKPVACLIENVKGLLETRTARRRRVIDVISDEFSRIGYSSSWRVLDAASYGVPQSRERLFIYAESGNEANSFMWPRPTHLRSDRGGTQGTIDGQLVLHAPVTLWEAISDLPSPTLVGSKMGDPYAHPPMNAFQIEMRRDAPLILSNHEGMRHTARIVERYRQIGFGQSESDVAKDLLPRKRGMPARISGVAYDQNARRQRPDRPCSTIPASSHSNFLHPFEHRNFTIRELARIQSFPDWFTFYGKRAVLSRKLLLKKGLTDDAHLDQRTQVGNAVPPLLAKALAAAMMSRVVDTVEVPA